MNRFWSKVIIPDLEACWLWDAGLDRAGYGRYWFKGKLLKAHRYSKYELTFLGRNQYPMSPVLDHLCSVRNCVNPSHLDEVTQAENLRRAMPPQLYDKKKECKHGHQFIEKNTYWYKGKRWCRECRLNRKRGIRSV